jgi:glycosyltransferase involved in cell wall biosynthesis
LFWYWNNKTKIKQMLRTTVSVCMITYGHEKYIREAIEGVLMQECDFEVELILANDCSPDKTDDVIQDILKNHSRRSWIKYFNHKENLGMMPNFIDTLKKCDGKYVALCEGDDYWTDPFKLQKQVNFLELNPDFVLCFHQVYVLKTNGEIVDDFITKVPENYETIETLARLGNYVHTPSVVFRNVINVFPFEFENSPIGDFFLYMMLAEHGKMKYMDEKMSVYRYGVGVFSSETDMKILIMLSKQYTCMLSYLKDEKIRKIVLERNLRLINNFENNFRGYYTSNNYLAIKKRFFDLLKIFIKKIFKYKLNKV